MVAVYDTTNTALATFQSEPIVASLTVFKILTAAPEEFDIFFAPPGTMSDVVVLVLSNKISTNFVDNPTYSFDALTIIYTCTRELSAPYDTCCGSAFYLLDLKLYQSHLSDGYYCDGTYDLVFEAHHPNFLDYKETYQVKFHVRYDCAYLLNGGAFAYSINIQWLGQDLFPFESQTSFDFTVNQKDSAPLILQSRQMSQQFSYSCIGKFEYVCDPIYASNCEHFSSIFKNVASNSQLTEDAPFQSQLTVRIDSNKAMLFDGSYIRLNGYIFSTWNLAQPDPYYRSETDFDSVKVQLDPIYILLNVKKNCLTGFVNLIAKPGDPLAEVGPSIDSTFTIGDPLSARIKQLPLFEFDDLWDQMYCSTMSVVFSLTSEDVDDITQVVELQYSQNLASRSTLVLIASENSAVHKESGCQLDSSYFTKECTLTISVSALFNGDPQMEFDYFSTFQLRIRNKCYNSQVLLNWLMPIQYDNDPIPAFMADLTIEQTATPSSKTFYLPRLIANFPGSDYAAFIQECGPIDYKLTTSMPNIMTVEQPASPDSFPTIKINQVYSASNSRYQHIDFAAKLRNFDRVEAYDLSKPADGLDLDFLFLPCQVQSVSVGSNQRQPNLTLFVTQTFVSFTVKEFTQAPACGFKWSFELTIIQLDSIEDTRDLLVLALDPSLIGKKPPDLGSLTGNTVTFKTSTKDYTGNAYAALVTGRLQSFETPFVQTFELVRFEVLQPKIAIPNDSSELSEPPGIEDLQSAFTVFFGETKSLVVGRPYHNKASQLSTKLLSVKCKVPGQQVKLLDSAQIILQLKVSTKTLDNICSVVINVRSTDSSSNFEVIITIVAQKFKGVNINIEEPSTLVMTPESPIIAKTSVDRSGQVSIVFDKEIHMALGFLNLTSDTDGPKYFSVTFLPNPINLKELGFESQNLRRLQDPFAFKWRIKDANSTRQLDFEFEFEQPEIISMYAHDSMSIRYTNKTLVTATNTSIGINFDPLTIALPRQQRKDEAQTIKILGQVISGSLSTFVSSNLLLTIFTSLVIYYVWGMINGLQIIAMTCLFKVRLPTNVFVVNVEILRIAAFDLFQTGALYSLVFKFSETPSFNTIFEETEFTGSIFIAGIGTMFLVMAFYPVFLVTRFLVLRFFKDPISSEGNACTKWREKIYQWFEPHNKEATILRFILEGNVDILIWAIISTSYIKDTGSLGQSFSDGFSAVLGWCMLLVLIYAPFHVFYKAIRFHKHNQESESEESQQEEKKEQEIKSMQELFADFKLDRWSLLYYPIFIVRRMVLVMSLMFMGDYGLFQISLHISLSFAMLVYVLEVRPYEDEKLNKQEIVNELFILVTGYYMLLFTDLVPDTQEFMGSSMTIKTFLGRTMLILLGLYILINFSIIIKALVQEYRLRRRKAEIIEMKAKIVELKERIARRQAAKPPPQNTPVELSQLVEELNSILPQHRRPYIINVDDDSSISELVGAVRVQEKTIIEEEPAQASFHIEPISQKPALEPKEPSLLVPAPFFQESGRKRPKPKHQPSPSMQLLIPIIPLHTRNSSILTDFKPPENDHIQSVVKTPEPEIDPNDKIAKMWEEAFNKWKPDKQEDPEEAKQAEMIKQRNKHWRKMINQRIVHMSAKPGSQEERENVEAIYKLGEDIARAVLGDRIGNLIEKRLQQDWDKVQADINRQLNYK